MAKETKEERATRVARENEEYQAEQLRQWPGRMMDALERATGHSMEIAVRKGRFEVSYTDSYNDRSTQTFASIPENYNDWNAMEELEYALNNADRREEEYRRKQALRQSALGKLSKEEREELGV